MRENRRQTLSLLIVLLVAVPLLALLFRWLGKGSGYLEEPYRHSEYVLDDTVELVLYGEDMQLVEAAADAAFAEMRRLDGLFNRHDPGSELALVNDRAHDGPVRVSEDLFDILALSKRFNSETGGAFDVTMGPIIDLWDVVERISSNLPPPTDDEIEVALARCGNDCLVLDEDARTVFLAREGMILDLGGVAKGYAADAARRVLEDQGIESGIINMISTSVFIGEKPRETGISEWRIGVINPRAEAGEYLGLITIKGDFCLSTSGDYQRFFMYDGVRYHHIFDPSTGRPAVASISDSILALGPAEAGGAETDMLSTALFVMGYPRAVEWAEAHGYELLIIDSGGTAHSTTGMDARLDLYTEQL